MVEAILQNWLSLSAKAPGWEQRSQGWFGDGKALGAPTVPILGSLHKLLFSKLSADGHEEYSAQPH